MGWLNQNMDKVVHIMEPRISDHALLYLKGEKQIKKVNTNFKFINSVTKTDDYHIKVDKSWRQPTHGTPIKMLLRKLFKLQPW